MKWVKGTAILTGICMGIGATFFAMLPSGHRAEAAIAVIDAKNIEEAIKTAISTANILTAEQKQLALEILNMKKLDANVLLDYLKSNQKVQQQIWDEKAGRTGVSVTNSTVETVWNERMGNIEDLLNGNQTAVDVYIQEQKRQKLLHDTYLDAAKAAKEAALYNDTTIEDTQAILQHSNDAEGAVQALQAGNALTAQQIYTLANTTTVLGHLVQMEATKNQKQALEETESMLIQKNSDAAAQAFEDSLTDSDLGR